MKKQMELVIGGDVYQLVAGFGFLHEVNKKLAVDVGGGLNAKKEVGLTYMLANMMDGDMDALVECIFALNVGQSPRLKKQQVEEYLEDVEDLDGLVGEIFDFLSQANVSRKVMKALNEQTQATKAK